MLNVLLIQIRNDGDPMAVHEHECVRRRIGHREVAVHTRNALLEPAEAGWLDGIDALVIGGSGDYSVHHTESEPWVLPMRRLLERALHDDVPGFAICFGHQLLGMHLGAPVRTDPQRTEIGTVAVRLTEVGKRCSVFGGLEPEFRVQTGHSDHVTEVPPGVELLATNDVCEAQAFRVSGTHFYSTQFHPDLSASEARQRYEAYRRVFGKISPAAQAAMERYDPSNDGGCVEELLGRFLDGSRRRPAL